MRQRDAMRLREEGFGPMVCSSPVRRHHSSVPDGFYCGSGDALTLYRSGQVP
jgi:hypothetical protein